jgi:6,7-dimethyl-8-ribityllumazine synthase
MPVVYEGRLDAAGKRFGIVVARTNEILTSRLLHGAIDCLVRHGARDADVEVAWVPGSFEVAQIARSLGETGRVDAVICLSALLRGETSHFEYLASEVTRGASQAALVTGVPVAFGVVTAESLEQGLARAGAKQGNKGWDAALAAIEMVRVREALASGTPRGRAAKPRARAARPRRSGR